MVLCDRVRDALVRRSDTALEIAEDAVRACPGEFELLLLAALAALAVGQSVRAQVFLKRHQKRYVSGKAVSLLNALAFAQQRQFSRAWAMLSAEGIETFPAAARWFVGVDVMADWLSTPIRNYGDVFRDRIFRCGAALCDFSLTRRTCRSRRVKVHLNGLAEF